MSDPIWLTEEFVLAVHRRQIAEHGGSEGVRDVGLLSSAVARPLNLHAYSPETADLPALGAAYAFGLARNHPFVDGNKRVALVACLTFLLRNGLELSALPEERYATFLQLAEGGLSEEELAAWLRGHVRPA